MTKKITFYAAPPQLIRPVAALLCVCLLFISTGQLTGCRALSAAEQTEQTEQTEQRKQTEQAADPADWAAPPVIDGLTAVGTVETVFAEGFRIYTYEDHYRLIEIIGDTSYLIIPEGGAVPEGAAALQDTVILQAPVTHIYLAATAVMSLFDAIDALSHIRFSSTAAEGWYVENAAAAMERGEMVFAGKYSEPDYEALLSGGCDLAVESTMLLHSPEVMEKLTSLGIPVLIDRSSYEDHPLGRTEWVKVYGALTGREEAADAFFEKQLSILAEVTKETASPDADTFPEAKTAADAAAEAPTVAFFFMNAAGSIVVRKTDDYIPRMISLAGGAYIFENLTGPDEESRAGSVTLSVEEFYTVAREADYLVYNGTIEAPLRSVRELTEKNTIFSEFTAVQQGRLYTTDRSLYQATDAAADIIRDLHLMLTEDADANMTYLKKVTAE